MAEMKDSGIEWCGKIPTSWNVMPNKYVMYKKKEICPKYNGEDILSLTMDGVIVRDLDAGGKMPASFDGYQRVKPNNLLMCLFDYDVTPRCIGLIQNEGLTSPAYSQFIMKNGNDARYYYYYYLMIDNTKELLHLSKNLRHSFTEDQLGAINTPVPLVKIQKQIAKYLDQKCEDIDAVYSDIEKQIETLEEYKKSIITEAVTKGLDPDVEMKDSGIELIGQIPNEWKISRLGWISKKIGDGIHGTVTFEDGETNFYFINGNNIKKRNIAIKDNTQRITERIYNTYKTNLTTHTILISLNGTIGNLAFYNNENVLLGKSVGFIELKEEYNREYIYYLLQANYIKTIFELSFAGTTINNLSLQTLRKTNVLLPPKTEQKKIVKYLDKKCAEIDGAIEEKKEQLDTLEQYKKSVIYEYVTGKKEVQ